MTSSWRSAAIALSGLVLAVALGACVLFPSPPSFWFLFLGAVLVAGTVFERHRYKELEERSPGPGWERTEERFVDPETGRPVTVFYHPATGQRRYVAERTARTTGR